MRRMCSTWAVFGLGSAWGHVSLTRADGPLAAPALTSVAFPEVDWNRVESSRIRVP